MPEFSKWSDLEKFLKEKIKDSLQHETFEAVRDVQQKNIDDVVYSVYKPKKYKRRDINEGLIADENIIMTPIGDDAIEVSNITKPNPYGIPQERVTTEGKSLPGLIEFGDDNGYGVYDFPPSDGEDDAYMHPRPFIQSTREDLSEHKQHIKAFRAGLENRGIKTQK